VADEGRLAILIASAVTTNLRRVHPTIVRYSLGQILVADVDVAAVLRPAPGAVCPGCDGGSDCPGQLGERHYEPEGGGR